MFRCLFVSFFLFLPFLPPSLPPCLIYMWLISYVVSMLHLLIISEVTLSYLPTGTCESVENN
jgi:hypothetical protein